MLKQILCCSLLIGQLYAGEHPRPPLPSELNAAEVNEWPTFEMVDNEDSDFTNVIFSDFEDKNEAGLAPVPEVPVAKGGVAPTPEAQAIRKMSRASKFTEAEDAGILQYVQDHPGRQNWDACLKDLTEQGIIAPGARTARQLSGRYNKRLKAADERKNYASKFTEAEDAGIMQYVQAHPGRQNWDACLECLTEQGIIAPGARTAAQLSGRYNKRLKAADERKNYASKFTEAEDAGIMQYVQAHPGRQNWDECLKALTEQGIIAPGARTAKQLKLRYNGSLKTADERKKLAPKFTKAEDVGITQYVQEHPGRRNWVGCLEWLTEQGIIAPGARTASQLQNRYSIYLKSADEQKKLAPTFTEVEDEALLQIVQDNPNLGWEERANLFAEMMKDKSDVQRTAMQLSRRYNGHLKGADERGNAPRFTTAEDAGILQYVQNHPGRQDWDECLKNLTEQGIIAPGARTTKQLCRRYNRYLKQRPEFAAVSGGNYAPRFTKAEDEALLQIVREHPDLSWEERAKLFAERMEDKSDVSRPANQLKNRYNGSLKAADERKKLAPRFTEAEDAGITLYVQEHPGRQNGDEGVKVLTDQDVVASEARTAEQVSDRYPSYLKYCPEFAEVYDSGLSDDAGEEDENF